MLFFHFFPLVPVHHCRVTVSTQKPVIINDVLPEPSTTEDDSIRPTAVTNGNEIADRHVSSVGHASRRTNGRHDNRGDLASSPHLRVERREHRRPSPSRRTDPSPTHLDARNGSKARERSPSRRGNGHTETKASCGLKSGLVMYLQT